MDPSRQSPMAAVSFDIQQRDLDEANDSDADEIDSNQIRDDSGSVSDDSDPVAEVDEPAAPKPEPSYLKASQLKFFTICKGLETVCRKNRKREHMSDLDKLKTILKPEFLRRLAQPDSPGDPPESIFPIMRLLLPDKDGTRSIQMKEKLIAKMYASAFGFQPNTSKYNKLIHFNNPSIVRPDEGIGDFSMVVYNVICSVKMQTKEAKGLSIGDLNNFLDELSALPRKAKEAKSNHDWRNSVSDERRSTNAATKPPNLNELRIDWLKRINTDTRMRLGLSPLEHKWLVRILLNKLHIGVGWKTLLKWYNPYAAMLWSAHNSLKGICDKLCDPAFSRSSDALHLLKVSDASELSNENNGLDSYIKRSLVSPQFGIPFSPMLSERTGFEQILDDISRRHRSFADSEDAKNLPNVSSSLSFRHPSFSVEPKLDGERLLVHVSRNGVVKMHTRRGNWYSDLYTPVLGPPIRRSLERWDFDVILDGEVLAWDSCRKETVPFGNNRTIARLRRRWIEDNYGLDPRDHNIHEGDSTIKSINPSNTWKDRNPQVTDTAGKECWLQFIVFDVIYVDGPEAASFLNRMVAPFTHTEVKPGSIINLDAFQRKMILYALISPQEDEVEIVKTWIVRSNGKLSLGENYFNTENPALECGHPEYIIDSLSATFACMVQNLNRIDFERRSGRSDDQISQARAHAVQKIYDMIVEDQRMEGLVLKDLSTPYILGEESKSFRYWHKFKPDYFNGSVASDLDVVVVGAYFATGLRFSGKPSSFLCACVDSEDDERFFTLCKVNMGSTDTNTANNFLIQTGFISDDQADGQSERNMWFQEKDHGRTLPDFLSKRTYQTKNLGTGWYFTKKDYPDLWIRPEDSRVFTLNAGEIVISDTFSAGLTLRFPRINKIRDGADEKPLSQIESDLTLWRIYQEVIESRTNSSTDTAVAIGSPLKKEVHTRCRFLTEQQYSEKQHKPRRLFSAKQIQSVRVAKAARKDSSALRGFTFHVFGGTYHLKNNPSDMAEAEEQGWIKDAKMVTQSEIVREFILNNGGRHVLSPDNEDTLVIGGSRHDPRVMAFIRKIEIAQSKQSLKLKSKKAAQENEVAKKEGVLRWTFLYSVVHRFNSAFKSECSNITELSIREHQPALMNPTILDYLARPRNQSHVVEGVEYEVLNMDIESVASMRRVIDIVSESHPFTSDGTNDYKMWQSEAVHDLDESERWVIGSAYQTLWPYSNPPDKRKSEIIIYPHIFLDFGEANPTHDLEERWGATWRDADTSVIESVLPLARIMGAIITTHLHHHVTHVICDLLSCDCISYDHVKETQNIFRHPDRADSLLSRIITVMEGNSDSKVLLISPSWLRKRKWLNES